MYNIGSGKPWTNKLCIQRRSVFGRRTFGPTLFKGQCDEATVNIRRAKVEELLYLGWWRWVQYPKKIGRESTSAMTCLLLGIPIAEMCIFVLSKMNNSKLLQGTLVWWLILKVWRPSVITLLKLDLKMDMQEMVWGKKGLNIAAGGPSGRRISGSLCEFGTSQGPVAPEQRRHGLYAGPSQLVPWMRKLGLWWKEMGWRQLQYCTEKLKWIFDAYPFYQKYIYIYTYVYIYIYTCLWHIHIFTYVCVCVCVYSIQYVFFLLYTGMYKNHSRTLG